jgi:aryl-alcohol dehydrogenase-like predicted oxidoreductase
MTVLTAGTLGASAAGQIAAQTTNGEIPQRPFGKTGIKVSAIGLGGSHIGNPSDENEGIRIVRTAIDNGITFMDNCWDYHNGKSEVVMGKALRDGYRQKVFLMTKFDGRTKQAAANQIDESLKPCRPITSISSNFTRIYGSKIPIAFLLMEGR